MFSVFLDKESSVHTYVEESLSEKKITRETDHKINKYDISATVFDGNLNISSSPFSAI